MYANNKEMFVASPILKYTIFSEINYLEISFSLLHDIVDFWFLIIRANKRDFLNIALRV